MASVERVEVVEAARRAGRLSASEKRTLFKKYRGLPEDELVVEVQKLETRLKRDVYYAAECVEEVVPYTTLQRTRDVLVVVRNALASLRGGTNGEEYLAALRIQCLCRSYLATITYRKKLRSKRMSFQSVLTSDDRNESALVIQNLIRQKLARNELDRRRSSTVAVSRGDVKMTNDGIPPRPASRSLPLEDHQASLLPHLFVHDVSGVPINGEELNELFASLDEAHKGYLTKKQFKAFYNTMEHYGVPESEAYIEGLMKPYSSLGADKLSIDEFAVLMLKLSQR